MDLSNHGIFLTQQMSEILDAFREEILEEVESMIRCETTEIENNILGPDEEDYVSPKDDTYDKEATDKWLEAYLIKQNRSS